VAAATGLRRGELFGLRRRDVDFNASEIHVTAYRKVLLERKAREKFSAEADFVFASTIGTPLDPNNFGKRELKPAIQRANKKRVEKELAPLVDFRWHDFRHYAVSTLIAQKADILTLARIAGHSDPERDAQARRAAAAASTPPSACSKATKNESPSQLTS
jgi:integrase